MDNGKVVVTCAITGGMTVPTQSEAIPVTVHEIVEAGVQAAEAGAAVLHLHVREEAQTNAELVTKAVTLAELFDKTPASPAEAREYLRLKGADRVAF